MFVIRHKIIFFTLSLILVAGSAVAFFVWGVRPGVDFVGGSILEVRFGDTRPTAQEVTTVLSGAGFSVSNVRVADEGYIVRMAELVEGDRDRVLTALTGEGAYTPSIERMSSVGPSVGEELRRKTWIAIGLVVLMIILYVAFAFRKISKPISSWNYGLVAVITLMYDISIPAGVFSVLGHFSGLEADTLFIVALLTILGLSVNDTIVVFDRIRENLGRSVSEHTQETFEEIVGKSLEQTYVRSFNTSLTVIIVLLVLFFLGGPTIHSFILTLLVGIVAGTYSSIFIASPLLVVIANRKLKG